MTSIARIAVTSVSASHMKAAWIAFLDTDEDFALGRFADVLASRLGVDQGTATSLAARVAAFCNAVATDCRVHDLAATPGGSARLLAAAASLPIGDENTVMIDADLLLTAARRPTPVRVYH